MEDVTNSPKDWYDFWYNSKSIVEVTKMKWAVKLYVGGKVFTENVMAINYQDAKDTALVRNPKARFIGANANYKDN